MRKQAITALATAASLLLGLPASADMYDSATLADAQRRLSPKLQSTVHDDIALLLPRAQRPSVAEIAVHVVPKGRFPLDFYSLPASRQIVVPIESVRFLDDVATLEAFFVQKGCEPGYSASYLAQALGAQRQLPSPLVAFGIDRAAAHADPVVGDVSLKEHQTMIFFILAHEVGHVLLGHDRAVGPAESQRQEIAADAFALDRFAEMGQVPWGLPTFFMTSLWLDPETRNAAGSTHPLSPVRLDAVADRLLADPATFASREYDPHAFQPVVVGIGTRMQQMAALMRDGDGFESLRVGLPEAFPASNFASACR